MKRSQVLLALICVAAPSDGQGKKEVKKNEPKVLLALPLGLPAGATSKLTIRGHHLEGAKEVRFVGAAAEVKVESQGKAGVPDKNPEQVGDTQVVVRVTLPAGTKGPLTFVVVTPLGETPAHTLLVDTERSVVPEKEPNEGFRTAQPVVPPVVIEGTVDRPRDVDVFKFVGKKGQTLIAEVLADRHGSALDAQLTLYRGNAVQVSAGEDVVRRDPRLEVVLPADDDYSLVLLDAHDTGSPLHAYRLVLLLK